MLVYGLYLGCERSSCLSERASYAPPVNLKQSTAIIEGEWFAAFRGSRLVEDSNDGGEIERMLVTVSGKNERRGLDWASKGTTKASVRS